MGVMTNNGSVVKEVYRRAGGGRNRTAEVGINAAGYLMSVIYFSYYMLPQKALSLSLSFRRRSVLGLPQRRNMLSEEDGNSNM